MNWTTQPAKAINTDARRAATERQQSLTKPPGSLGALEDVAIRLAGMLGEKPAINNPSIVVFAADHGVAEEGVSAFPQAVTGEMVRNFANGGAAICALADAASARLEVVTLGTVNDPGELPGVIDARIAPSTGNMVKQLAMTEEQLEAALEAGRTAVGRALAENADVLVGGDMGIGNTTASAALACAALGVTAAQMAGPGTGLDQSGVHHKAKVIDQALLMHREHLGESRSILRCLGGFEIAALTGAMIAAAIEGIPFIVDGFIASSAAMMAIQMNPGVADWLVLSHVSAEPGYAVLGDYLIRETGSCPLLDLGMRLGEGSGAALVLPLLRSACIVHNQMATFAEAGVSES